MDGSWSHPGLRGVQQAASRTTGHPLALNAPSTRICVLFFLFGPPVSVTARRPRRLSTSSPRPRLVPVVCIVPRGGAGQQGSVAGTAAGLLCTRYIGLATQARWSSSQTTRLTQARSQLHETWLTKYYSEQVRLLTCCVQPERASFQVNQVELR